MLAFRGNEHGDAEACLDLLGFPYQNLHHDLIDLIVRSPKRHHRNFFTLLPVPVHATFALPKTVRVPRQVVVECTALNFSCRLMPSAQAIGRRQYSNRVLSQRFNLFRGGFRQDHVASDSNRSESAKLVGQSLLNVFWRRSWRSRCSDKKRWDCNPSLSSSRTILTASCSFASASFSTSSRERCARSFNRRFSASDHSAAGSSIAATGRLSPEDSPNSRDLAAVHLRRICCSSDSGGAAAFSAPRRARPESAMSAAREDSICSKRTERLSLIAAQ